MDKKKIGNAGLLILLAVVAAGIVYAKVRAPRYVEHAGGTLRIDQETGRQHILVKGRWRSVPEVDQAKLQSKIDRMLAEQVSRQIAFPTVKLPVQGAGFSPEVIEGR